MSILRFSVRSAWLAAAIALSGAPALSQETAAAAPYSGPAYQYEGKWMATVQSGASGAAYEVIATCANPIILTARDANTLQVRGGSTVQIAPVDGQTFAWTEQGVTRMVTPESEGNFIALVDGNGRGTYSSSRIVSYLRCGTAGATARDQVCVAE